ncbi:MAG: MBL fold metallo-hydrolase [Gammaproteobacteria bacterium]|nr:MBL fold metallo-hydrolase [Gammaproteobacteria bacterium]MDE0259458.1 MBL fold metallo-hydrolase [Gammaproteobacteria bacterium]
MTRPRVFTAANPGPFTLDGTRTYIVGREEAAVIDPGPDDPGHLRALRAAVAGARRVAVLVTHDHADHSGCARALADALGAPLLGPCRGADGPLGDGAAVETDQGELLAVDTPGHCAEHLCFHWPRARALFAGDLMLGEGSTTWVGEYPGCVRDYLRSLERIEALAPRVIYSAHGPPIENVPGALAAYREHRLARIEQAGQAQRDHPAATPAQLVTTIYGDDLPPRLRDAAEASIAAMLDYLAGGG